MDIGLLGVVVGAVATLFGTVMQNVIGLWKDKQEWERRQKAEEKSREHEAAQANAKEVREAYYDTLHALSVMITHLEARETNHRSDIDFVPLMEMLARGVPKLWMRCPTKELDAAICDFFDTPSKFHAVSLREFIIAMASREERLLSASPLSLDGPDTDRGLGNNYRIKFYIDHEFRQKQFAEGKNLPPEKSVILGLEHVSKEQRQLLAMAICKEGEAIPKSFYLPIPAFGEDGEILFDGEKWHGRIDLSGPERSAGVLKAWERDYREALEDLQSVESSGTNSGSSPSSDASSAEPGSWRPV